MLHQPRLGDLRKAANTRRTCTPAHRDCCPGPHRPDARAFSRRRGAGVGGGADAWSAATHRRCASPRGSAPRAATPVAGIGARAALFCQRIDHFQALRRIGFLQPGPPLRDAGGSQAQRGSQQQQVECRTEPRLLEQPQRAFASGCSRRGCSPYIPRTPSATRRGIVTRVEAARSVRSQASTMAPSSCHRCGGCDSMACAIGP